MAGSVTGDIRAEPNLTPLLDVVFQLITFFMLVINFSNASYDQSVHLPVAGSARPWEPQKGEDKVVLNINKDGQLIWDGQKLDMELALRQIHTLGIRTRQGTGAGKLKMGDPLPTTVVLRADRDTQFSKLFAVISACQAEGFQRFSMRAMTGN
jgi:biopolymer transport protein ExbD